MTRISVCFLIILLAISASSPTRAGIPVLLYHPQVIGETCTPDDTDVLAMRRDIAALQGAGFAVVPLSDVVDWALGSNPGWTPPPKAVAITTDDGHNRNYLRTPNSVRECGAELPSVREIAEEFNAHVTLFVVASRSVRDLLSRDSYTDDWWFEADQHPLLSVENHSLDHDHSAIQSCLFDPLIPALVPASGSADGRWVGELNPLRWTNYQSAAFAVQQAARYIRLRTGRWPTLFAHPMGVVSPYLEQEYLPEFGAEHKTRAAFCTHPRNFVAPTSPPFCLPRLTRGDVWVTQQELFEAIQR